MTSNQHLSSTWRTKCDSVGTGLPDGKVEDASAVASHGSTIHRTSCALRSIVNETQKSLSGAEPRRAQLWSWPRLVAAVSLLALLSTLTACGGGDDPPAATSTPAPPTQTPMPPPEFGQIVWATDIDESTKAPQDQVTSYPHDAAAIYAVVPVTKIVANTPVTAEWDYDGVPMPELTTTVNAPDLPNGGWIEFHVLRTTNLFWPVGTFHVRVSVNGQPLQEASVPVQSS
jgi:hypothetical protein